MAVPLWPVWLLSAVLLLVAECRAAPSAPTFSQPALQYASAGEACHQHTPCKNFLTCIPDPHAANGGGVCREIFQGDWCQGAAGLCSPMHLGMAALVCEDSTDKCVAMSLPAIAACELDTQCLSGRCVAKRCAGWLHEGQPCDLSQQACANGLYCSPSKKKCAAPIKENESCWHDRTAPLSGWLCAPGSSCVVVDEAHNDARCLPLLSSPAFAPCTPFPAFSNCKYGSICAEPEKSRLFTHRSPLPSQPICIPFYAPGTRPETLDSSSAPESSSPAQPPAKSAVAWRRLLFSGLEASQTSFFEASFVGLSAPAHVPAGLHKGSNSRPPHSDLWAAPVPPRHVQVVPPAAALGETCNPRYVDTCAFGLLCHPNNSRCIEWMGSECGTSLRDHLECLKMKGCPHDPRMLFSGSLFLLPLVPGTCAQQNCGRSHTLAACCQNTAVQSRHSPAFAPHACTPSTVRPSTLQSTLPTATIVWLAIALFGGGSVVSGGIAFIIYLRNTRLEQEMYHRMRAEARGQR